MLPRICHMPLTCKWCSFCLLWPTQGCSGLHKAFALEATSEKALPQALQPSKTVWKHTLFLCNFQRLCESTCYSLQPSKNTQVPGHAFKINCCQALKADVSPKMSCCITFDIHIRFTITELVQTFFFLKTLFTQEIYWSNNILIFQIIKLCFLLSSVLKVFI